jgi:hypothetical protein
MPWSKRAAHRHLLIIPSLIQLPTRISLFTSLATYPFYICKIKFSLRRKVKATERKGFTGIDCDMNVQATHTHYSDGITLPFRAKTSKIHYRIIQAGWAELITRFRIKKSHWLVSISEILKNIDSLKTRQRLHTVITVIFKISLLLQCKNQIHVIERCGILP